MKRIIRPGQNILHIGGACALALLFPIALVLTFEEALLYGVTPALKVALILPLAAFVFAIGAFFLAAKNWKTMNGSGRIYYGSVMAAMVAFAGWLSYWNLLGWRF